MAERLPDEVIAKIFNKTYRLVDQMCPQTSRWTHAVPDTGWLHMLRVCRRWRDVGLSTPDLWRTIRVTRDVRWFYLCLARSGGQTIRLIFPTSLRIHQTLQALIVHTHLLRSITVVDGDGSTLTCLQPILLMPCPALEEVLVDNHLGSHYGRLGYTLNTPQSNNSILRSVNLGEMQVRWHTLPKMVSNLREIRLHNMNTAVACSLPTFKQFMTCLQACVRLESLELEGKVPFQMDRKDWGVLFGPVATLPLLKSAHLALDNVVSVRWLLNHLQLKPQVQLEVVVTQKLVEQSDAELGLLDLVPNDRVFHPGLKIATRITMSDFPMVGLHMAGNHGDVHIVLLVEGPPGNNLRWGYTPDRALSDVCTICGVAATRSLSIKTKDPFSVSITTWKQTFCTFGATLTEMNWVVDRHYPQGRRNAITAFLTALSTPDPDESEGGTRMRTTRSHPQAVLLPHLRALHIEGLPWHRDVLPSLRDCLKDREKSGRKLTVLRVRLHSRSPGRNGVYEAMHAKVLVDLREIVAEMSYEDIVEA